MNFFEEILFYDGMMIFVFVFSVKVFKFWCVESGVLFWVYSVKFVKFGYGNMGK